MKKFELKIDVFWVLITSTRSANKIRYRDFFRALIKLPLLLIKDILKIKAKRTENDIHFKSNYLYVHLESFNNYSATQFLEEEYKVIYTTKGKPSYTRASINLERINYPHPLFDKWRFIVMLFIKRNYSWKYFESVHKYYYSYDSFTRYFEKNKPSAYFFSNDHNPVSRSLLLACRNHNVPTYFIQHGSTSEIFPPLKFSVAFLYGNYDYNTYKLCGYITSTCHLVGMQNQIYTNKKNKEINNIEEIKTIGVAFNTLDTIASLNKLFTTIIEYFDRNIKVIVRPHPRDRVRWQYIMAQFPSLTFSDPLRENPNQFISRCDVIISGVSGILLEAVLQNTHAIQCNLYDSHDEYDYYEYIKNGIVSYCHSPRNIISCLKAINFREDPRYKAKYYDASLGKTDSYSVKETIVNLLNEEYGFERFK